MNTSRLRDIALTAIALLAVTLPAFNMRAAAGHDRAHIADSLYSRLRATDNPSDSLTIMNNLFDVLPRPHDIELGDSIFDVANRAGNSSDALAILRNLSTRYMKNDSMLAKLYDRTLIYTDKRGKQNNAGTFYADRDELMETRTFIRMTRNMHQAMYASDEERDALIHDLIHTSTSTPPTNLYDKIVLMHAMCTLLSRIDSSELLINYMDSLEHLIDRLPQSAVSLRNTYNVHAAIIYRDNGHYEKSMQADKRTLEGIEKLEENYRKVGRPFRNYNANRYIIYARILSNFPILPPHEIEKYYNLAKNMVEIDRDAADTYAVNKSPEIYYNLSYKNYSKALPYIKEFLANRPSDLNKRLMLKYEIECAEALGDNATLLAASREYNKLLETHMAEQLDDKIRELQIINDTYNIRNSYNMLQLEKQASEASMMRYITVISAVAVAVLLILVLILFRLNRRKRDLLHTLDKSNQQLRTERENLEQSRHELIAARDQAQKANNLKSDFIKNMSYEVKAPLNAINEYSRLIADCVTETPDGMAPTSGKHLSRFADMVELNSELLSTLIDDVLRLSEIESSSLPIQAQVVNLRSLSEATLAGIRHRVRPGVDLQLDPTCGKLDIFTDPTRLQQILNNMLTNAAKFTSAGSITLSYRLSDECDKVNISVTDTGIGINPKNKEKIFERFVKLDRNSQGAGLGLTISRLLARHLGGELSLDTSYSGGARFVLTLPKK